MTQITPEQLKIAEEWLASSEGTTQAMVHVLIASRERAAREEVVKEILKEIQDDKFFMARTMGDLASTVIRSKFLPTDSPNPTSK